jgi:hypothetical protein
VEKLSELFLNNYVIVYLFSEAVLFFLALYLFYLNIKFVKFWDFESFTPKQTKLEKQAYLASTMALLLFTLKLILLIYFVYMIDSLSIIIPGAMCGAGVISANSFGIPLLFVKLTTIFTLLLFLTLNNLDLKAKNHPYFKFKTWVLLLASLLIFAEVYLDISYFFNIDLSVPVSCCSALFGNLEGANPLPFGLDTKGLLVIFYTLYIASILALVLRNRVLTVVTLLLFLTISYYSIVYFFGTYIYELPTHKCPFCMMQKEYGYVGYFVWGLLFFGVFFGLIWAIIGFIKEQSAKLATITILLLTLFLLLCSAYVAIYYIKNGVFLM